MKISQQISRVIEQNLELFKKPGVLSVRPGYQAVDGWPTRKPAIVVNVDAKRDDLPPQDRLPETVGGYAVDVRQPNAVNKLRLTYPQRYTQMAGAIPPELRPPIFRNEYDLRGTDLSAFAEVVAASQPTKDQIPYSGPAGKRLNAITDRFKITCHASPDAGWPTLGPFLEGTKDTLTIGMYDFTAAHILETIKGLAAAPGRRRSTARKLNLVLDHPPLNKTHDQTDDDTREALDAAFGSGLRFAWALERNDPKVDSWIYPSAYHIKVAVRDSAAFWLSSGNFNNSNQPDIDPINDSDDAQGNFKSCDRDWHVIVEHPAMAQLFEAFLLNDLAVAESNQEPPTEVDAFAAAALAGMTVPDLMVTARTPSQFFKPKVIADTMQIQPILTPDNYAKQILKLIGSAEKSFYMQTQYITPSDKEGNEDFTALIAAVAGKISDGLDVRLILSQYETLEKLEMLQDAGVDVSHVRIQANVHNKGMIVDSKVVAVGSQNWSGDGTLRNRDATLIIYNEEAAQYWEQIFMHDWTHMSFQRAID